MTTMHLLYLLLQKAVAWRNYRKTREALEALDVRTLGDIGVQWAEIEKAARRAAMPA